MRSPRSGARSSILVRLLLAAIVLQAAARPARGQATPAAIDDDIARQQQIVARFLTVVERNPRRGTALDKIYGFHIENGTIEEFVKQLRQRTAENRDDGAG